MATRPHVVFIHLDLGIGGAEALVLSLVKATCADGEPTEERETSTEAESSPSGSVSIYTTHCSPAHCFDEVRPPDGSLSSHVHVRGSFLPRNLLFGGTALCSALRMLYLTYVALKENPQANVFVVDVLPTGVPYLVEYCNVNAGVLFYCHFPDKLLTRDTVNGETSLSDHTTRVNNAAFLGLFLTKRMKQLKRIYRCLLDWMEEWTMSYSDIVVVNSKFTKGEVENAFPSLFLPRLPRNNVEHEANLDRNHEKEKYGERVKVLYPSIESSLSKQRRTGIGKVAAEGKNKNGKALAPGPIVSLNRFERKKNIALVIHAYDLLLEHACGEQTAETLPPLVIAGGYDPINVENVEHLAELRILADKILDKYDLPQSSVCPPSKSGAGVNDILEDMKSTKNHNNHDNPQLLNASIQFRPSISNTQRTQLLSCASVWCYTPHREHFGIVPLEAMDAGVPVVAIKSGGPKETIVDGVTGYLVDFSPFGLGSNDATTQVPRNNPTVKEFANAIRKILSDPSKTETMGQRGRERVDEAFGMETFRKQWWELLRLAHKHGFERHHKRLTSYPRLGMSMIRWLGEIVPVALFAIFVNWAIRKFGLWGWWRHNR